MRAAEQALFDSGISVSALMEIAAGGAAEWIRRIAAGRSVTVLCGPGNNGGDGYVIARRLAEAGNDVQVIAPLDPATHAARAARELWGKAVEPDGARAGGVLVDCLFGSGLTRELSKDHKVLLCELASLHHLRVAVDLPSGIATDSGAVLNEGLPDYHLTLALGAWKPAHWSLPGRLKMGQLRLVPIGIAPVAEAAQLVEQPRLAAPAADSHKYRRGLVAVVAGAMPGASLLSASAAQRAGAGYVKLLAEKPLAAAPPDLVCDGAPLETALGDERIAAVLIGPGLGRDEAARARLTAAISSTRPMVLDADALMLLGPRMLPQGASALATPHDGELAQLAKAFGITAPSRRDVALAIAKASGMVIIAKGPDTLVAAPDGRLAMAPPAPAWLSVAGTGDVLAGIAVSRLAAGRDPFTAACEAVWLHGEAARKAGAAFTASQLAERVSEALAACL
jgi:ADP-dependent NAD(P)H-hydrate dehydratase / NAD(P)H-hydrate epimerase